MIKIKMIETENRFLCSTVMFTVRSIIMMKKDKVKMEVQLIMIVPNEQWKTCTFFKKGAQKLKELVSNEY